MYTDCGNGAKDDRGGKLTIRELSQLFYLNREIEQEKERIKQLQDAATNTAVKINGMPFVGGISDKTAIAAAIADSKAIIDAKLDLCVAEYNRLCRYVAGIDDSLMRQIISLRFINGLTWHQVAQRIGGGNTEESVKKACYRYIKSCPECHEGM